MNRLSPVWTAVICIILAVPLWGQPGRNETDAAHAFVKKSPTLGEPFPDLTVYDSEGKSFDLAALRGSVTVVTFGCMT